MAPQNDKSPSVFRHLDWVTVFIYLAMVLAGAVSIYAASYDFDNASILSFDEFSGKQLRWIGLGLVLGLVVLLTDARAYETYAYPIYVVLLIVLIITPFIAHDIKGSRSWISLGPMSLQPAEFAKVATALALAKLFNTYNFVLNARASNYVRAIVIILLPIVFILLQNETGSALTFLALFFVLYREGMSGLILFAAALAVVVFVVTIKFTGASLMGIAAGELVVLVLVMLIMSGMTFIYDRRLELPRNLVIWFGGVLLLSWILWGLCGVAVPGMPVLIGAVAVD